MENPPPAAIWRAAQPRHSNGFRSRIYAACFVTACFIDTIPAAKATVIDWTLQDVTFNDGGTASGSFATDSATGSILTLSR